MNIKIQVDGVLYDMPEIMKENFEDCIDSKVCKHLCFLDPAFCGMLCSRVKDDIQRRNKTEQSDPKSEDVSK